MINKKRKYRYQQGGQLLSPNQGITNRNMQEPMQQQTGALNNIGSNIPIVSMFKQIGEGIQQGVAPKNQYGYSESGDAGVAIGGLFNPKDETTSGVKELFSGKADSHTALKFAAPFLSSIQSNREAKAKHLKEVDQANIPTDILNFQNANRLYEQGGSLNQNSNITEYTGLPHDFGGLPLTENIEVENNETRGVGNTKDYIFSDSLYYDPKKKITFAKQSKKIENRYKNYENDKFAVEAKDKALSELMFEQESLKKNKFDEDMQNIQLNNPEQFGINPEEAGLMQGVYKKGGKIYIKPSKRGTFTAAAKQRGLTAQEFASQVMSNKERYTPSMVKKANFARNASRWKHEFGGNIYGIGGPIDPPTDGGKKRYLNQEDYNTEVEKRKQEYDLAFSDYLAKNASIEDMSDPQLQKMYRLQFEKDTPFDISDIAINPQINPIQVPIEKTYNQNFPPIDIEYDSNLTVPTINQNIPENPNVFNYGSREGDFNFEGKNFIPNTAAITRYKNLIDQGKLEEANKVILGHFQTGKGGGGYKESTHGEGVSKGLIKPITPENLWEVGAANAENKIKGLEGMLEGLDYTKKKYGGKLYQDGGPITPKKPDRFKKGVITELDPESLQQHRQFLRYLHSTSPDAPIQDYSQYTFGNIMNPEYIKSIQATTNAPGSIQYTGETDKEMGYFFPSIHGAELSRISGATERYKNAPVKVPFTERQFKENYQQYRPFMNVQDYNTAYKYIFGKNPIEDTTPGVELTKEDVMNMVQQKMNTNDMVSKKYGGYMQYGGEPNYSPTRNVYLDPNQNQIQNTPDVPYIGATLNTNVLNDNKPVLTNTQNGGYNINTMANSPTAINYNAPGTYWNQKENIGKTFTPTSTNEYLVNNLGINPEYANALTNNPKLMQDYFDFVEQNAPQSFFEERKQLYPNYKVEQALGSKDRFGQHHQWTLDPYMINRFMGQRENINEINPLGPPTLDNPQSIPPLAYNPNVGYQQDNGLDGGYGGQGRLKPFRADLLGSAITTLPNVGMGIANLNLANNLNFDRTNAEIMQPDYVDPTRAIQELRNQYAGAKDLIRQNAGGSGSLLSNIIGATASQSEATSGTQAQYDTANAGIYNQAAQFNAQQKQAAKNLNAQIQQQEERERTALRQQGYGNLANALNTGINTYYQSKRDADKMNLAGGENFYYKRVGPAFNQTPVRVFKGNNYHYYEDPNTGETKFLNPNSGNQIKSKEKIKKYKKELKNNKNI